MGEILCCVVVLCKVSVIVLSVYDNWDVAIFAVKNVSKKTDVFCGKELFSRRIGNNMIYFYKEEFKPTISMFRGIKIYINWNDHMPPHFHATYAGCDIIVSINDLEVIEGEMPSKQQKMVIGWAAFHQTELLENWELAVKHMDLFTIDPLQ